MRWIFCARSLPWSQLTRSPLPRDVERLCANVSKSKKGPGRLPGSLKNLFYLLGLGGFALGNPAIQLRYFEVGDESDPFQDIHQNPGVVNLVPCEPVTNRGRMGMV